MHGAKVKKMKKNLLYSDKRNSQASLALGNPTVGNCIELKSRDTRAIPVKSATHNNRCSMVYT